MKIKNFKLEKSTPEVRIFIRRVYRILRKSMGSLPAKIYIVALLQIGRAQGLKNGNN